MSNLEVLAPVGSFKNLKLAINSGANAVYFGVKNFNARQKAENVDLDELHDFVKLAHLHNVKTYMTLNTLIKNNEVEDVLKVVDKAIDCKVDAFIVQDIGLATFLLSHYKNIVLHASTQMGIHNLDGARFLEKLGFKRVVLSRETKLNDIKEIKSKTNLEIEYFVQGALCVAFSGNCYFSSLCFNESGNRGRCLQPCRMLYEAFSNNKKVKEGFLLSPKDLCLIGQMKELIEAGVESFKIEGRLRRESYLIQAVSSYVKSLKEVDIDSEISKLKKIFSRGDYNYGNYLNGADNIIDYINGNHRGEKIGRVINYSPFKDLYKIEIKVGKKLNSGDGIKIIDGFKEISLGIGNVESLRNGNFAIYTKHKPFIGDIYLSLDSEYEQSLIPEDKRIPLKIEIQGKIGSPLKAIIKLQENRIEVVSDFICEAANNKPLSKDDFVNIFERTRDTQFYFSEINIDIDEIFVVKSSINKFKNNCIVEIEKVILENFNKNTCNIEKLGEFDKPYEHNSRLGNNNAFAIYNNESLVNDDRELIYSPVIYNFNVINNYLKSVNGKFVYINLPIFCTGEEVKIIDDILYSLGKDKVGIVVNNYWGLKYLNDGFKVIVGYNMNIINNWAKDFYETLNVDNFIRSIESPLVSDLKGGLSYEGYPTLMTWCHCPYKVSMNSKCDNCKYNNDLTYKLNDGKTFKIRRYKIINCYFELVSIKKLESKSKNKVSDLRN